MPAIAPALRLEDDEFVEIMGMGEVVGLPAGLPTVTLVDDVDLALVAVTLFVDIVEDMVEVARDDGSVMPFWARSICGAGAIKVSFDGF